MMEIEIRKIPVKTNSFYIITYKSNQIEDIQILLWMMNYFSGGC